MSKKITELTAITAASSADADNFVMVDVSAGVTHKMTVSEAKLLLAPAATTAAAGIVEKSTSDENVDGTSDAVFPSVAGTKEMIDTHAAGGWEAYDGGSDPVYWTYDAGNLTRIIDGPTFVEDYNYRFIVENVHAVGGSSDPNIQFYLQRSDTGDYSDNISATLPVGRNDNIEMNGLIDLFDPFRSSQAKLVTYTLTSVADGVNGTAGTATPRGGLVRYTAAQRASRMQIRLSRTDTNFGGGSISIYRQAVG